MPFLWLLFAVSSLKVFLWAERWCSEGLENSPLKTVHVQLSGGHSDDTEDSIQAINQQERIFKMFLCF